MTVTAANVEFGRYIEMASSICGATFSTYPGMPARTVRGRKDLRKCWQGDGSVSNCRKLAWILYYAPSVGHKRFREGVDWATLKEERFMTTNMVRYEVTEGQGISPYTCIKGVFAKHFNMQRQNILRDPAHGTRLRLENPLASVKGEISTMPVAKKARMTRKNGSTFFVQTAEHDKWAEVKTIAERPAISISWDSSVNVCCIGRFFEAAPVGRVE